MGYRENTAGRKRHRRQIWIIPAMILCLFAVAVIYSLTGGRRTGVSSESEDTIEDTKENTKEDIKENAILEEARILAAMYDYDKAVNQIKSIEGYEDKRELNQAVKEFEAEKASLKEYPLDKVTHVFFHSLIVDPSRAFDGDYKEADYNQSMATVEEFRRFLDIMYRKGYVLVSLHDLAALDADGGMVPGKIMLPEGRIPFVLSQDDVSYYHYMDGDGFASRLVLDENRAVKAEYVKPDGKVIVGDYDMVPILDSFVREHPDFSYHGRKGILALTGYNGVLGYRTDVAYKTGERLDPEQAGFLKENPGFDFRKECADAKEVARVMKENGWEFASHTWGHKDASASTADQLITDDRKWRSRVAPVIGDTDIIIFAFGADIGTQEEYHSGNPKYDYFISHGYRYFCPVDGAVYRFNLTKDYLWQGRRNIDGYRMYYGPGMLEDLFEVKDVWDEARPVPVPQMS